jgi:adenosylcobinamide-phosphate synthase
LTEIVFRLWLLVAALVVDFFVGDPPALWRRIGHPVTWYGSLISFLDTRLNSERDPPAARRTRGMLALAIMVVLAGAFGLALENLFAALPFGWIGTILVASIFMAQRSLLQHIGAVADAFASGGVDAARKAVTNIVGRDPEVLDEAGVCRAAIESAAENFSDGVVAPAFWFVVAGLPGLFIYKAVNTADSMIGYRTTRYEDFGWAAARLDDVLNWPAARLSALLIAIAAPFARGRVTTSIRSAIRDARRHRSPNAGWPEAAMAGALDIALAGPRFYAGMLVSDPFLNAAGRLNAAVPDIRRAMRVILGAWLALLFLVDLLALTLSLI